MTSNQHTVIATESKIIIAINALKKIISIFLGPFLTAYFVQISPNSVADIITYYIIAISTLTISTYFIAKFTKNRSRLSVFRFGVTISFLYILLLIVLRERIPDFIWLLAMFYGLSSAAYWQPCNLLTANKVANHQRTAFTAWQSITDSTISIIIPFFLGSIISATNFEFTAYIILAASLTQIFLSFKLTPDQSVQHSPFDLPAAITHFKSTPKTRRVLLTEFLNGISFRTDGAINTIITLLIIATFQSNFDLGSITSIATIFSVILIFLYNKSRRHNDNKFLFIASIAAPAAALLFLFHQSSLTLIIYDIFYTVIAALLLVISDARMFSFSRSPSIPTSQQIEFFVIRELFLNLGRIASFLLLAIAHFSHLPLALPITLLLLSSLFIPCSRSISKIAPAK